MHHYAINAAGNKGMDQTTQMQQVILVRLMLLYRNDPKFSDSLVWANSADPDQTALRSSLIRVLTICNTVCIFWMHYSMVKPLFPVLCTAKFSSVRKFRNLTVFSSRDKAVILMILRLTLASGTFFRQTKFPLPLIQDDQVVGYCQKNGQLILVNCLKEAYPGTVSN